MSATEERAEARDRAIARLEAAPPRRPSPAGPRWRRPVLVDEQLGQTLRRVLCESA